MDEGLREIQEQIERLTEYAVTTHWVTIDLLYANSLPTRRISCPLCGYENTRDGYKLHVSECQFGGGRLERYACPECDLVFGALKMLDLSEQQLSAEYKVLYSSYREADCEESEIRSFNGCRPMTGGVYLNWGSGAWSGTIEKLRAEGWDVWGYEPAVPPPSPYVAGSVDAISAKFDAIFSNNVVEHLRDPVAEFRLMRSFLKPGGVMTHSTECYDLTYENTRFHLFFYLGRSVERLAAETGFEVIGREDDGLYHSVTFQLPA